MARRRRLEGDDAAQVIYHPNDLWSIAEVWYKLGILKMQINTQVCYFVSLQLLSMHMHTIKVGLQMMISSGPYLL